MAVYGLGTTKTGGYRGLMNEHHTQLCPSPEWAAHLQQEVLPYLEHQVTIGDDVLELGPGPGAATEWLCQRAKRLVVVEIDADAARQLEERFVDANVEVRHGDASRLELADDSFDTVVSCTMLHHVPTTRQQNQILAEAFRVLRPGGSLIGSDSLPSNGLHHFHVGDTYNPIEPSTLLTRLLTVGFTSVTVVVEDNVKFIATKPDDTNDEDEPCDDGAP